MKPLARVKVTVPASTSNLGPGFDSLGLALGLYNEVILEHHPNQGEPRVLVLGAGAETLPRGRANLIARAASALLDDRLPGRLVFTAKNHIPLGRGLGSSGAAVVAGLLAANALLGRDKLSDDELLTYAVTLEGHPDNAAPALRGGLVACIREEGRTAVYPLRPHPELAAVLCVPDFELSTEKSRAVLPPTVLRADAVENIGRALLLASALERGRWKDLPAAMGDRLHQPYRRELIPGFDEAILAARSAGAGAALSGAGPSLLALCRRGPCALKAGKAMQAALSRAGVKSRVMVLPIDREGARVEVMK